MINIKGEPISGFHTLLLYVPAKDEFLVVRAAEGEGLSDEDYRDGYEDTVSYDRYNMSGDLVDGGFQMFSETIKEKYHHFGEVLPQVIDYIYDGKVSGVANMGDADGLNFGRD